ncbi:MAG: hypothetical protein ABIK09_12270 [Pseudomonadota bacterium]
MFFPYVAGYAHQQQARVLWLTFGVETFVEQAVNDLGHRVIRYEKARLGPLDARVLASHLEGFDPTHVLASEPFPVGIDAVLADRVLLRIPDASVLGIRDHEAGRTTVSDQAPHDDLLPDIDALSRIDWLVRWLDLSRSPTDKETYLVESAPPCHGAIPANARAWRYVRPWPVLSGSPCTYAAPISRNPRFKGVAVNWRRRDVGCSFCTGNQPPVTTRRLDPIDAAQHQIASIQAAMGVPGHRLLFDLYDGRVLARLPEFVDMLRDAGVAPADFLVSPRMDELLRIAADLDPSLSRLGALGHRLRIRTMGVENFSPEENERFNKGISSDEIESTIDLVSVLVRKHGDVLQMNEPSFILFTPWTSLASLRANVAAARRLGLPDSGHWLASTLFLYPDRPITRLAEHDGVERPGAFDDVGLELGLWSKGAEFVVPWRFLEARILEVFRVHIRYWACTVQDETIRAAFGGDPLFADMSARHERLGSGAPSALRFLEIVIEVADNETSGISAADLVDRTFARFEPAPTVNESVPQDGGDRDWAVAVATACRDLHQARPDGATACARGIDAAAERGKDGWHARLAVEIGDTRVLLRLFPAHARVRAFVETGRLRAMYDADTPPPEPGGASLLQRLVTQIDQAVEGAGSGIPT